MRSEFADRIPRPTVFLLFAIVATLVIRVATTSLLAKGFREDPDAYRVLAVCWAQTGVLGQIDANGQGIPSAYRPPLYPWLLSWMVRDGSIPRWSIVTLHSFLAIATCVLVFVITRILLAHPVKSSNGAATLACLLVAVDPLLVRQSALIMTETLATCLAVCIWLIWLKILFPKGCHKDQEFHAECRASHDHSKRTYIRVMVGAMVMGFVLAINTLCRPTGLIWGFLLVLAAPVCWFHQSMRWRIQWSILTAIVMLLSLLPWAERNRIQLGQRIWMTTHGGYTLMLANNPLFYDHLLQHPANRAWDATEFHRRWQARYQGGQIPDVVDFRKQELPSNLDIHLPEFSELRDDALAQKTALAAILHDPSMFAKSAIMRIIWLWAWWPGSANASPMVQCVIGLWYAATSFGVIAASFSRRANWHRLSIWMPMLLLAFSLTVVHAVYWSNMRMRAPVMPAVYVACALVVFDRRSGHFEFERSTRRDI